MKRIYRYIPLTVLNLFLLGSCVVESVVEEVDHAVGARQEAVGSKAVKPGEGYLALRINNEAENTCLQIDSLEICNVLVPGEAGGQAEEGNVMIYRDVDGYLCNYGSFLTGNSARLCVQTFTPWSPETLPEAGDGMYVKIYGKMYTYIAGGTLFPLYEGPMYFTFNGSIAENYTTEVKFDIYDNCPLYCEAGGKMTKVLQSISFDVNVEDWVEVQQ